MLGEDQLFEAAKNEPRRDNRDGDSSKKRGGDMQNVTVSQQMTFIVAIPAPVPAAHGKRVCGDRVSAGSQRKHKKGGIPDCVV